MLPSRAAANPLLDRFGTVGRPCSTVGRPGSAGSGGRWYTPIAGLALSIRQGRRLAGPPATCLAARSIAPGGACGAGRRNAKRGFGFQRLVPPHRRADTARPTIPPRPDLPVDALQEPAEGERLLRADTRTSDTLVHVGTVGARISFRTAPYNEHTCGSLTASVVNEIAATSDWAVSTIHDPLRRHDFVQSMLSIVYAPEPGDG